jgi:NAD(P)-dependent dehydrogenase (short-subunit alcohol dehydrogenase family)
VALVTRAAKRIGRGIAERLVRKGYVVAIHCHFSTGEAHGLAAHIGAQGSHAAVADVNPADPAVSPRCRATRSSSQRVSEPNPQVFSSLARAKGDALHHPIQGAITIADI